KITSTFLAFTLISFGLWFGSKPLQSALQKRAGAVIVVILIAVNGINVGAMALAAKRLSNVSWSTYVPSDELTQIRKIESMDFVSGINVMNDSGFDLFWAHYFTLRKRQIFEIFPYSGREVGALTEAYRLETMDRSGLVASNEIFGIQNVGCLESY